jgi:hypothetical protein
LKGVAPERVDQFRIDDLTHARRHLVTSGDSAASFGRIDRPDAATKRLRIDVTPGAPVTAAIRFVGNTAIDNARLAAEVIEAGLDVEARFRSDARRARTAGLQRRGYLKAEVTGKPQTIDGTTGVLLIGLGRPARRSPT